MCDQRDDEVCDVWSETKRKARKEHRCDECRRVIAPGEVYVRHFSMYEGMVSDGKICTDCDADRRIFADEPGHLIAAPGMLVELIQECIEEEPESEAKWQPMLDRIEARS